MRLTLLSKSGELESVSEGLLQLPGLSDVAARVNGDLLGVSLEITLAQVGEGGLDRSGQSGGEHGGEGEESGCEHCSDTRFWLRWWFMMRRSGVEV